MRKLLVSVLIAALTLILFGCGGTSSTSAVKISDDPVVDDVMTPKDVSKNDALNGTVFGFELFNVTLVISFVFFLYLVWQRKSKVAPFGPALAPAVLVTVIGKVLFDALG